MSDGEVVKPSTDEESECFQLIQDLDYIDRRVSGSITSKKSVLSCAPLDPIGSTWNQLEPTKSAWICLDPLRMMKYLDNFFH